MFKRKILLKSGRTKYGAYEVLANKKQLTWCPCWAHVRRKFVEAESGDPPFRKWCYAKSATFLCSKELHGHVLIRNA